MENLHIYLADQFLKGSQSADNQFQALQNQATESFSVYGTWLQRARSRSSTNPSFCTDFSPSLAFNGLAGFGTWRIFVPLFWATCRLFSIIPIFFGFWNVFVCKFYIYSIYPYPVETSRGSIFLLWSFYTLFTLCPFETKRGEYISFLDRECIFKPVK